MVEGRGPSGKLYSEYPDRSTARRLGRVSTKGIQSMFASDFLKGLLVRKSTLLLTGLLLCVACTHPGRYDASASIP